MADAPSDDSKDVPLGDLFAQLLGANPVSAMTKSFDQFRKSVGDFIGAVESFGSTMKVLGDVATRVQALLDVVEEPIRNLAGRSNDLADIAPLLREVAARLEPLGKFAETAGVMFGLGGKKP